MKLWTQSIILIIIAIGIVGQVSLTPFVKSKCNIRFEIPLEEAGDEDTDGADEMDKIITEEKSSHQSKEPLKTFFSLYSISHSEPIQEIVPPPPKA